jgi:hypothetical protein
MESYLSAVSDKELRVYYHCISDTDYFCTVLTINLHNYLRQVFEAQDLRW